MRKCLGDVTVHEVSSAEPALPHMTVSRLQDCFSIHGGQLQPGRYHFNPVIELDADGRRRRVKTPDMPDTAPDLVACTRIALRDMAIPSSVLNLRSTESVTSTNDATAAQRLYLGNPAVAVVVVVGLSEIVLEAGATTILFAVTVKVVEKAAEDVAEALKRRRNPKDECTNHFDKCMATASGDADGNHWKQTLCGICHRVCINNIMGNRGGWPSQVGNGSCEYWSQGN